MKKIKILFSSLLVTIIFSMFLLPSISKVNAANETENRLHLYYFVDGYEEREKTIKFNEALKLSFIQHDNNEQLTIEELTTSIVVETVAYWNNPNNESYIHIDFEYEVILTYNQTHYHVDSITIEIDGAEQYAYIRSRNYEIRTNATDSFSIKTKEVDEPAPPVDIPQIMDENKSYIVYGAIVVLSIVLIGYAIRKRK